MRLKLSEIKDIIKNVIKETIDDIDIITPGNITDIIESYQQLQYRYNNFWKEKSYSLADFFEIMMENEKLEDNFQKKFRHTIFINDTKISRLSDERVQNELKSFEKTLLELNKKIKRLSIEISKSENALKQLDEVEQELSLF